MTLRKQNGIRLAKRLEEVGFSDIVQIRNKVMSMRAEGLQIHALHGGEPYFETPVDDAILMRYQLLVTGSANNLNPGDYLMTEKAPVDQDYDERHDNCEDQPGCPGRPTGKIRQ